ncbi:MAG: penicillin-binding protein 1A [Longimicrobiales bacterium]
MSKLKRWWRGTVSWLRARPRFVAVVVIAGFAAVAFGAGLLLGAWQNVCYECPSIAQLYVWEPKQATKILSHDGKLIAELFQERRTPVPIEELPPYVSRTFLTVEDRRFYQHGGFDVIRFFGAILQNLREGWGSAGASTITQQLARNMFSERIGFDTRITRKLKELHVALELEEVYSKDEILEAYLNQINFGHGWYGIETAAQRYFGVPARDLNPAQTALLAALPKAPSRYSPFENPELALQRRNLVLSLMSDHGVLSGSEMRQWRQVPLPTEPSGLDDDEFAPYFVEWVRDILDTRFGTDLYQEGFQVYTTLDMELQSAAAQAMIEGWTAIEQQGEFRWPTYAETKEEDEAIGAATPYLQGAFVALDPETGAVRALIGGRDFGDSKFNRATQAMRQPGSAFKPVVYTAAIASGIPASHVIFDSPLMLEMPSGDVYSPRNYGREFMGPVTLRQALMHSINTVAVKLAMEIGLETVVQYARRLGIETPLPRFPSIAIGAAEVVPLEIAAAYGSFATLGTRAEPRAILRVVDSEGRVLWETQPERSEVLDAMTAYIVTDLLRDVVDVGTAYNVRAPTRGALPTTIPAAGKTGTTNEATDVWFIGFTPDLLAAIWFGFDQPRRIIPGASGGGFAAPVFGQFMRTVYAGENPLRPTPPEWQAPADLVTRQVDNESGQLATRWCPIDNVYAEIYVPGTEPSDACELHDPGLLGGSLGAPPGATPRAPLGFPPGTPLGTPPDGQGEPPPRDTSRFRPLIPGNPLDTTSVSGGTR